LRAGSSLFFQCKKKLYKFLKKLKSFSFFTFIISKMAETYDFERYITDATGVRDTLDRFGVAVIPSLLDDTECERIVSGIWDFFEHVSSKWEMPIRRDNQDTWREIYKLYPLHSMLFQYFHIGHAQVSWDVRQNEKILEVFSRIWNCAKEDLLVSFDGLSFSLPHEITRRGWNRNNTWYHTDQSFLRPEFECVQSWVTGLDVDDGDATLGFMEGSHRFHKEFAERFGITDKSDWFKLTREQEDFYLERGCVYKKIRCPKGSLVLWDSRTIHCGVEALKNRAKINTRAIVYVCYTPRRLATPAVLRKRIKAFEELRTTTHWPHKGKLFGKIPRTYGNPLPEIDVIDSPTLSEIGLRLVGY
jgi:ectoine hydroxylase-related dioxygenase (phytanoyl-CoA dioxygenase family)